MIDQSFEKLVDSLAAKTPTPGGGAAAALAGCMGAALLLMVVRMARGRKANVAREEELAKVEQWLAGHVERLKPMADRDCKAYDRVMGAYAMPKDSDEQKALRDRVIQESMVGAMVVPEETLCMVRDVFEAVEGVLDCVHKGPASDMASGSALLVAAADAALLNVRINAAFLHDRTLADETMVRAKAVRKDIQRRHEALQEKVEKLLA